MALDFALSPQFTLNFESQQLSHEWHFQCNTKKKWTLESLKLAYILVFSCIILVVAKISDATFEHRLHWNSSAWKVYIRERIYHVSQASNPPFYKSLGTQNKNHDTTYTQQEYDGNGII